uniref:Uncharacterized protein n=1 Tax=Cyprinus carpio TaxID=7962 RepID=A0A8C1WUK7_CYPCA
MSLFTHFLDSLLLVEYFLLFISLSICRQRRDEQLSDSEKMAETCVRPAVYSVSKTGEETLHRLLADLCGHETGLFPFMWVSSCRL